jgi:acetyl esterase/lipase
MTKRRIVVFWSRAAALSVVLTLHLTSGLAFAAEPSVETNVVFGTYSGLALLMDVYKPATSNGFGIVVINGSGWYRDLGYEAPLLKQSQEFRPAVEKLVAAGYTAFVIAHRASPRFHIHDIVDDAQRATRFVRANASRYGIRSDRVGALGGSSGGHLVSMLGALDGKGDPGATDPVDRESAKVQCVVAFYPAIDLAKIDTPSGSVAVSLATGVRPPPPNTSSSFAAKQYQEASPITYVTPDDPPFLLLHGDADKTVPFQQSEIMEQALRKAGVPVKLIRVPGGGHGNGSAGWSAIDWAALTLDWFESRLRQSTSSDIRH